MWRSTLAIVSIHSSPIVGRLGAVVGRESVLCVKSAHFSDQSLASRTEDVPVKLPMKRVVCTGPLKRFPFPHSGILSPGGTNGKCHPTCDYSHVLIAGLVLARRCVWIVVLSVRGPTFGITPGSPTMVTTIIETIIVAGSSSSSTSRSRSSRPTLCCGI